MSPIGKFKTVLWFAVRPSHWAQAVEVVRNKFRPSLDAAPLRARARDWAAERAVNVAEALAAVGLVARPGADIPQLSAETIEVARALADGCRIKMGGAGHIQLLYAATILSGATRIIESGVAYGWSSLAILTALERRRDGRLVSVDMPYVNPVCQPAPIQPLCEIP
jgi:hypothetical protein